MRHPISTLGILATLVACVGPLPPPPDLTVTSPSRGMVQGAPGRVTVTGQALPGASGGEITKVMVNELPAMLAADGTFTATVDVPPGASLLETTAYSAAGSKATDARAVQIGELRPVGTPIERAVSAALSKDTFAELASAAGTTIEALNIAELLAGVGPMRFGNDAAHATVTLTSLALADVNVTLTPVDGGLELSVQIDGLRVAANVVYGGIVAPEGATAITATADQVVLGGTLAVTADGTAGFQATVQSPVLRTTALRLQASGLVGEIVSLLNEHFGSTIQRLMSRAAESALAPMMSSALGALAGAKQIDVLGRRVSFETWPSEVRFTRDGALVTMDLQVTIAGSESSPGYVFTPNGTPAMDVTYGIQLGLADDLINQLLAEVHALGLLEVRLQEDFGLFDAATFKLAMPPMVSANNSDGRLRLVLGDMIASFSKNGQPLIGAALNAQIDLAVARGTRPEEIALDFGKVHLFVNVLDDEAAGESETGGEVAIASAAAIGLQLDSLEQFLITVPVPTVAGVTLDELSLRADAGYAVVSGKIH